MITQSLKVPGIIEACLETIKAAPVIRRQRRRHVPVSRGRYCVESQNALEIMEAGKFPGSGHRS